MPVNIRLIETALGERLPGVVWLASFDPAANDGRGAVVGTPDRAKAAIFDDFGHAMRVYKASPACHPTRETDGKPNRPLTAYTIEVVRDDVEPLPI